MPVQRTKTYLAFESGGRTLALDNRCVCEIVFYCTLSRPPTAAPFLAGLLDLGGTSVPVLALDRLLGLAAAPPDLYAQIVIAEAEGEPLGLLVTRVHALVRDGETAAVAPGTSFADCVTHELSWAGGRAEVLALDRLLIDAEAEAVAHFRGIESGRRAALAADGQAAR